MFMWTTWAHASFDTIESNRHPFCADYLLVIYIAFVSKIVIFTLLGGP